LALSALLGRILQQHPSAHGAAHSPPALWHSGGNMHRVPSGHGANSQQTRSSLPSHPRALTVPLHWSAGTHTVPAGQSVLTRTVHLPTSCPRTDATTVTE